MRARDSVWMPPGLVMFAKCLKCRSQHQYDDHGFNERPARCENDKVKQAVEDNYRRAYSLLHRAKDHDSKD
jgi:hypothetical protein